MSLLDRLKFWKKSELEMPDFEMPKDSGFPKSPEQMPDMSMPGQMPGMPGQILDMPQHDSGFTPPAFSQSNQFSQPSAQSIQQMNQSNQQLQGDQQMQLISAKLDTIKAQLETVLQRLDRLEHKEEPQRWRNI